VRWFDPKPCVGAGYRVFSRIFLGARKSCILKPAVNLAHTFFLLPDSLSKLLESSSCMFNQGDQVRFGLAFETVGLPMLERVVRNSA
jgi:hypothetical protein